MASMTIRNLDEDVKGKLRVQAAKNNRSMEDEARDILRTALARSFPKPSNLADSIRFRLGESGVEDLDIPEREPIRAAPDFS